MAEDEGEQEAKENVEVWTCCSLASPPHGAVCCLRDHHLPWLPFPGHVPSSSPLCRQTVGSVCPWLPKSGPRADELAL